MTAEQLPTTALSTAAEILSGITEALRSGSAEGLAKLYAPSAKLSLGSTKVEGAAAIASHLISTNTEWTANSYDVLTITDNHLLISGTCTWGNEQRYMALVASPATHPSLHIVNHIISGAKL
jgi:hypothetical protein